MKNLRGQEGRPFLGCYSTLQVNQAHLIFGERAILLCHHRHYLPIPQEVKGTNVQLIVTTSAGRKLWMMQMCP